MLNREVVYAAPGKDESAIERFSEEIEKHNASSEQITNVSMDMSPAYIKGASNHFRNADITFDKFHVIKLLNEAIDEIRRTETAVNPCLKGSRYIWLKNPEHLTVRQSNALKTLSKENRKLSKAYQMKLTLQDIYRTTHDYHVADVGFQKWLSWAVRSRLGPIKRFAKMFKSHLTARFSEGTNSRIQELKRMSKGFRNINYFISMIYLGATDLVLPSYT